MKTSLRFITLMAAGVFLISSLFDPATMARSASESPSLLFLEEGILYRYQPGRQQPEKASLPGAGKIMLAELSRDGQRLVYIDAVGVNVAVKPFKANLFSHPLENTATIFAASLSRNGRWLAYSDDEALKVVNTSSGKINVLFRNKITDTIEDDDKRLFIPAQWSPDDKYLAVIEEFFEELSRLLLFSMAGEPTQQYLCYYNFDWHPSVNNFIGSANRSERFVCGGIEGVFVHSGKGTWSRRLVYNKEMDGKCAYDLAFWNPSGTQIVFVQEEYFGNSDFLSKIMLVRPNGAELQELTQVEGRVTSLQWAGDETGIFFIRSGDVFRHTLGTSSGQLLFSRSGDGWIEGISPDGQWLAVHYDKRRSYRTTLFLIRTDGSGAQPIRAGENLENSPVFVGWE